MFQKLCKHGYAVHENEMLSTNENGEEDGDSHTEGAVCEYRSSGDVVYVIDKTSIVWPTYVKCIVVERIQINENNTNINSAKNIKKKKISKKNAMTNNDIDNGLVKYLLKHCNENEDENNTTSSSSSTTNSHTRSKSKRFRRRSSKKKRTSSFRNKYETKSDGQPNDRERSETAWSDGEDEEDIDYDNDDDDDDDDAVGNSDEESNHTKRRTLFAGAETVVVR